MLPLLQRLLDGYIEQVIERNDYRVEKAKLLSNKKSLEETIARASRDQQDWIEPMPKWIKVAQSLETIARDGNFLEKKVAAEQTFGSNLRLAARRVSGEPMIPYSFIWAAADWGPDFSERVIVERDTRVELASSAWKADVLPLY